MKPFCHLFVIWTQIVVIVLYLPYSCSCKYDFKSSDTIVTCEGEEVQKVPQDLPKNVTGLYLSGTSIRTLQKDAFSSYSGLKHIFFRDSRKSCMLENLEAGAFSGLNNLKVIGLIGCERLTKIDRGVFGTFKVLHTLQIYRSGLTSVPDFSLFHTENVNMFGAMDKIDLSSNKIDRIQNGSFNGIKTNTLKVDGNKLRIIESNAFKNSQIIRLKLNNNPSLVTLQKNAFDGIMDLQKLDLSHTAITNLPTTGLTNIQELSLKGTKTLRTFPSILQFSKIKKAELYYPHHCCAFKNPEKQNPDKWRAYEFQRKIQQECTTQSVSSTQTNFLPTIPLTSTPTEMNRGRRSLEFNESSFGNIKGVMNSHIGFGNVINVTPAIQESNILQIPGSTFLGSTVSTNATDKIIVHCGDVFFDYSKVECTPEPDAFNPCEDVMGYEWLRIFVWIVVMAALFGNIIVLLVLISSRSKITVTKFLMCNLAFADFLMGIYLLLLASIDAHTLGEYFNYAILWQNEGGCQAAGFITVFSSELSIFTLTVITLERWYAISHAIHLTKRLKLRQAVVIMAFGWSYAAFMAHLPLVGISYYGNVSVCLPMEVEDTADAVYIISLLVLNGLAFVVICMCYVNMYFKVRGSESTVHSSDATIAKRMAMLVFTNFICWAPIAFFGLTASAGAPLIDITNSKILLVFFYPLNSCANPYLYVIITKQFRKDMYVLLGKYGMCHKKANKYKGTFTNSKSLTQSRKDSLALNNLIHPVDVSFTLVTDNFKGSKDSLKVCTPNLTPNLNSRSENFTSSAAVAGQSGLDRKQSDRKLSIVPELSQVHDQTNQVGSHPRRSVSPPPSYPKLASGYVLFYRAPKEEATEHNSHDGENCDIDTYDRGSRSTDLINKGQCDRNPWVLRESEQTSNQDDIITDRMIETEFNSCAYDEAKSCYKTQNHLPTDNEIEDDSVREKLLKHRTLRDSPASIKNKRIHHRHAISVIVAKSPSSSSLNDFDETSSLCNED